MLDGPAVAAALRGCGVTHVVWVPDSEIGTWEPALTSTPGLTLIRVCREGEAFALAAGLWLGGKKPVVAVQCTGFFEAGDALRNVVYDMKVPLFFIVGIRSYYLHLEGKTTDSCPLFAEPLVRAWQVPYVLLDRRNSAEDLADVYRESQAQNCAGAVLLAE